MARKIYDIIKTKFRKKDDFESYRNLIAVYGRIVDDIDKINKGFKEGSMNASSFPYFNRRIYELITTEQLLNHEREKASILQRAIAHGADFLIEKTCWDGDSQYERFFEVSATAQDLGKKFESLSEKAEAIISELPDLGVIIRELDVLDIINPDESVRTREGIEEIMREFS